jgi:hypothetical protein
MPVTVPPYAVPARRKRRFGEVGPGSEQNHWLASVNWSASEYANSEHLRRVVTHRLDGRGGRHEAVHRAAVDLRVRRGPALGDMRCLGGVRQRKRLHDRRRLSGTGRHP